MNFEELKGKIFTKIEVDPNYEFVIYTDTDGNRYQQSHHQECCESVWLSETIGDTDDLVGSQILLAECREGGSIHKDGDISGWVFYELRTIKGSVTFRWNDSSNGYYSVDVELEKLKN